jgi:hypothetical protein
MRARSEQSIGCDGADWWSRLVEQKMRYEQVHLQHKGIIWETTNSWAMWTKETERKVVTLQAAIHGNGQETIFPPTGPNCSQQLHSFLLLWQKYLPQRILPMFSK